MRRRAFIGLGCAFVGAGTVYGTGAFDAVQGERATSFRSVSDPDAYLGIDNVGPPEYAPRFTNNLPFSLQITLDSSSSGVEFDTSGDGSFTPVPVTFNLESGESLKTKIDANVVFPVVDISGTMLNGSSDVGGIEMSRTFQVPQAGQVEITPDVKSAGSSGRFEFGLENTGSINATLVGMGIFEVDTPADETVTQVGGRNQDNILEWLTESEQLLSEPIAIDSTEPDDGEVYHFDDGQTVELLIEEDGGEEQIFRFDRFRQADNSNADMRGGSVKIFLEFEDQSTTIDLAVDDGDDD